MNEKLILTDCDGVLLDWEWSFHQWMSTKGWQQVDNANKYYKIEQKYSISTELKRQLVRHFNESAGIGYLTPFRDAVYYVKRLHERHGYTFHAITSLSTDYYAGLARINNLKALFGETVFSRFVILDTGADKDEALAQYAGTDCWWVEDHIENVEAGIKVGLNGILMAHDHNRHYNGHNCMVMENWKQLYNYITG
jgi:FMN phosphatase YigB (HAD superfamily)